jgi:hypothetical protein
VRRGAGTAVPCPYTGDMGGLIVAGWLRRFGWVNCGAAGYEVLTLYGGKSGYIAWLGGTSLMGRRTDDD